MIATLLSFGLVAASMYYAKFVFTSTVPIKILVTDSQYFDGSQNEKHYCWVNPGLGGSDAINNILARYPEGCNIIRSGSNLNTYVGHQFVVVVKSVQYTTMHRPKILTVLANMEKVDVVNIVEYDPLKHFDLVVEWQRLVVLRKEIVMAVACVLFVIVLLSSLLTKTKVTKIGKKVNRKETASKLAEVQPTLLPRNIIKGYAVITMLLNHIGHVFIPDTSLTKLFFTILADAGGSMHLFNWLVGYNVTATQRSSEVWLLGVFVFMQICVELPPPVTYETLLNISIIRWLLNTPYFRVDSATGRSHWADAPIFVHAALIIVVVFSDGIIGTEGLKLVPANGLLFAACGRLFAMPKVDLSKHYLWLAAACVHTMYGMRYNLIAILNAYPTYQVIYGSVYAVLTLLHTLVVNWKVSTQSKLFRWSPPTMLNTIMTFLSRNSLEIYLVHFVVFKVIHDHML